MISLNFFPLSFFDYQLYTCIITRLIIVIFSNFFHPKSLIFFLFLLFFNLKHKKIKEKEKNNGFERKKLEKVTVVRRLITQEYH